MDVVGRGGPPRRLARRREDFLTGSTGIPACVFLLLEEKIF
jgi:hypothetical protein